ncbi:MAG TPA: hypothetical protein PLY88_05585 [Candidatus Omnitrophota bacterium]|nr:hypothetical protein [Candidatus Omnitrophota bacterium]
MQLKKPILIVLFFLMCFALYKIMGGGTFQVAQKAVTGPSVAEIDYSVVVPPEKLPQFKDTVLYKQPAPEKDPLWMNPNDQELMPPKDPNDPYTGVL